MSYPLLNEYNISEGVHIFLIYLNDVTGGIFMKMLLFSFWCVILFGLFYIQKKTIGTGDFSVAFGVAGFVIMVSAFLLRLVPGLIDDLTLGVCIAAGLLGILALIFDDQ